MGRKTKAKRKPILAIAEPTPEQFARNGYERAGLAYRRVCVIDSLFAEGKLRQRQFDGLKRFRDVAIAADRSPIRDSLDQTPRGMGSGMPPSALRVNLELGRLNRALGALEAIARAVAVDDLTLSQWAMQQNGSVMRHRNGVIMFEPTKTAFKYAWLELRMAGEWLASEIGA